MSKHSDVALDVALDVAPDPASQSNPADAAVEALLRLTQSAEEFLKYQSTFTEGAETRKTILLQEELIREKDEKIRTLESAITVFVYGGQKEVSRMKLEKAEIATERDELNAKLEQIMEEKRKAEELAENNKQLLDKQIEETDLLKIEVLGLRVREEALRAELTKEVAEKESVALQLCRQTLEVEKYYSYTTNLTEVDMTKLYGITPKLCGRSYYLPAVRLALRVWRRFGSVQTL